MRPVKHDTCKTPTLWLNADRVQIDQQLTLNKFVPSCVGSPEFEFAAVVSGQDLPLADPHVERCLLDRCFLHWHNMWLMCVDWQHDVIGASA
jgi:hypothetical protein